MEHSSLLKTKNPFFIYILFVATLGAYFLQWGPYVIENLNYINRKDFFNLKRIGKLILLFFIVFIILIIFFAFIGPISFSNTNQITQVSLTVIFFTGFIMACIWFIALLSFFGYVNYKIDKLIRTNFNISTTPLFSTAISVLLAPFFLSFPYTQYKLNKLIFLFKEHNQITEVKAEETLKKDVKHIRVKILITIAAVVALVVLIIYGLVMPSLELMRWKSEIQPYTDDFLRNVMNENYKVIFDKYALDGPLNLEEFLQRIEKFNNEYGKIQSYEYEYLSETNLGNTIIRYLYYPIELNSGKKFLVKFRIIMNSKTNRQYKDKISLFEIADNQGRTVLHLPLIKADEKNKGSRGHPIVPCQVKNYIF